MEQGSKRVRSDSQDSQLIKRNMMIAMLVNFLRKNEVNKNLVAQLLENIKPDDRAKYFEGDKLKQPLIDNDLISPIFLGCDLTNRVNFVETCNAILSEASSDNGVFMLLDGCNCSAQDMRDMFAARHQNFLLLAQEIRGQFVDHKRVFENLKTKDNDFCDRFWGDLAGDIKAMSADDLQKPNPLAEVFKRHCAQLLRPEQSSSNAVAETDQHKLYLQMRQQQEFEEYQRRKQPASKVGNFSGVTTLLQNKNSQTQQ